MRLFILALVSISCSTLMQAQQVTVPSIAASTPAKGVYNIQQATQLPHATTIVKNKKLGDEGYILKITPGEISIKANTQRGLIWGEQTLQQLAIQHAAEGTIPCQTITDQPDYPLRGFMLDCGRKYIPMSYLHELVDVMSFYKLNTLHLHLNDNGFKKYFHDNWAETYAGFRMQSDLFPGLTSKDGFYTKQEMRDLIRYAEKQGVEIIPEFDVPAHSLAFSHYRPSLASEEFGADHLNLRNPDVIPFVDSLLSEYLGGPDPVFCCPRMHIGTDEYSNKDPQVVELFRAFTDHLIHTVESYGKQAVLWGSLTHANGTTPVKAEGVLMDMWYNGYADPTKMKELGYDMVSIPDGYVYIVPEAGYYYNYLNCQYLYEHWTPAQIGNQKFDERDPQIKGGMFALWNDVPNGISVGDLHHRILPAVQVIAEKTWHAVNDTVGYAQWNERRKNLGDGIAANELGITQRQEAMLAPRKHYDSGNVVAQIGYDYQVDFDITWASEALGTELFTSQRARFFLSDPIGGWMGFSRDGELFTFKYKGVAGISEHITIKGTNRVTSLYVNGKLIQELNYDQRLAADAKPYNIMRTLVFPLQDTGDFASKITNFTARKL